MILLKQFSIEKLWILGRIDYHDITRDESVNQVN